MAVEFFLNGNSIKSPLGWQDITLQANFGRGIQPNITFSEFTFGLDSCALIDSWIKSEGFFSGMPLSISLDSTPVFELYLDFKSKFLKVHQGKYIIAVKQEKSLNQLIDRIEGNTFGLVESRGGLTYVDVPYVVEKDKNLLELAILGLTTSVLIGETISLVRQTSNLIQEIAKGPLAGISIGAFILGATLKSLTLLITGALVVIQLIDLVNSIIESFISPVRFHRSINCKTALTVLFNQLGYNSFQTGISKLSNLTYFPSKIDDEQRTLAQLTAFLTSSSNIGIPKVDDFGYSMAEFIELLKTSFDAVLIVDNLNNVHLRSRNDPYFSSVSSFKSIDILTESEKFNTEALNSTRLIAFSTDIKDEWTTTNYKGTAYEIITERTSSLGENLLSGLEEIRIAAALGSRKDGLNTVEIALKSLASFADKTINLFGGSSNLASKISNRIGMVKVSQNQWGKPKLLLVDANQKLAANHRDLWSAKVIYEEYYNEESFVLNSRRGQKREEDKKKIKFSLIDFNLVGNNSLFTTFKGETARFTDLQMKLSDKTAIVDYLVDEVYDINLTERYVEP